MKNTSLSIPTEWRTVFWVVLPIYLLANLYLLVIGESAGILLLLLAYALYMALLGWFTVRATEPAPAEATDAQQNKSRLWIQIAVLSVIILITGLGSRSVPIWSNMVEWFHALGESFLPVEWFGGPGNSVANPMQYFVIPFLLLLLLGAKPAELGFGKGHQVRKTCLIWLALPFVFFAVLLAMGTVSLQMVVRRFISNFFQNGFFEEFLFRGALQTRLGKVVSTPWALTLQAFLFGLWHLRANTQMMDGNLLAGLAFCIISQTVAGFAFGVIYHRTRNLIAPSLAHVFMNMLGQTVG
jgi:membrane protease YdiL (CAAX protease family)